MVLDHRFASLTAKVLLACLGVAAITMLPLFVSSLLVVNPVTGVHADRFDTEDEGKPEPASFWEGPVEKNRVDKNPVSGKGLAFREADIDKMMKQINSLTLSADFSTLNNYTVTAKVGTFTCELAYRELQPILEPLSHELNQYDNLNMIHLQQRAILEIAAQCDHLLLNAYAKVLGINVVDEELEVTGETTGESFILTARTRTSPGGMERPSTVRRLILNSTNPPTDEIRESFLASYRAELMAAAISERLPNVLTKKQLLSAELQQYKKSPTMENFYRALRALSEFTIRVPEAQFPLLNNLALEMLHRQIRITKA